MACRNLEKCDIPLEERRTFGGSNTKLPVKAIRANEHLNPEHPNYQIKSRTESTIRSYNCDRSKVKDRIDMNSEPNILRLSNADGYVLSDESNKIKLSGITDETTKIYADLAPSTSSTTL